MKSNMNGYETLSFTLKKQAGQLVIIQIYNNTTNFFHRVLKTQLKRSFCYKSSADDKNCPPNDALNSFKLI